MRIKREDIPTQRFAVLSMDIEDWYHLDYFDAKVCDKSQSMLDGLDFYRNLLSKYEIFSSFFCVGEIAQSIAPSLRALSEAGHDIGSHTYTHTRPLSMSVAAFDQELDRSKKTIEDAIGSQVDGFRAPCFSLDDERLERVRAAGFLYDSSRIAFKEHPNYGCLKIRNYKEVFPWVFEKDGFCEFQVSTLDVFGKKIPISGGGYLRIFPWWLTERLVKRYLTEQPFYVLYIHPFELSRRLPPNRLPGASPLTKFRFRTGLGHVESKLESMILLLRENGFVFKTFRGLRQSFLGV